MELAIPGRGSYEIHHLVLDVNGTVAVGGQLIDRVPERLAEIQKTGVQVHWITADTRGRQTDLDHAMGFPAHRLSPTTGLDEGQQKALFVESLGARQVIAIGNGTNDTPMLRAAAIGIAVLGPEGLSTAALLSSDLIAPGIHEALDLLVDPARLVATLRT